MDRASQLIPSMMNLLVMMSGGTTPVINATLTGIIKKAQQSRLISKIYAAKNGINGVYSNNFYEFTDLSDEQLEKLKNTPGSSSIGTSRVAKLSKDQLDEFIGVCEEKKIKYVVNIGGNGTVQQTKLIANHANGALNVVALPKTVDNDLGDPLCRDVFFNPGFPSCVNYWAKCIQHLNIENIGAASHDRVVIAQTFGRDTGFLAGSARAADKRYNIPMLLLLPEDEQPLAKIIDAIEAKLTSSSRALVIISEGYNLNGCDSYDTFTDATGQTMHGSGLTTAAQKLAVELNKAHIQSRTCIPTLLQRQSHKDIMKVDIRIAEMLGIYAIQLLEEGASNFFATISDPTSIRDGTKHLLNNLSLSKLPNLSRRLDRSFIAQGKFDVSAKYIEYLDRILKLGLAISDEAESDFGFSDCDFFSR